MPAFRIGVEVGHMIPDGSPLDGDLFPRLSKGVRAVAEAAHAQWQQYAAGAVLPDGREIHARSGAYLRSIMLRQNGPFSADVYSELPEAYTIEEGTPRRDMKDMLGSSLKVRLTKDGRRYLIIPFRWGTPGTATFGSNVMAKPIHSWWKDAARSSIIGKGWRDSGTGAISFRNRTSGGFKERTGQVIGVRSRKYEWGSRLDRDTIAAAGVTGKHARNMEGMVNFRRPGKAGGASQSSFLTFRVMMEGSPGWIQPARPGYFPARTTADELRPIAERIFGEAIARDLAAALSR